MPTSIAAVQRQQRHNFVENHFRLERLGCLFPQNGPGLKHQRTIELAPWQEAPVRGRR